MVSRFWEGPYKTQVPYFIYTIPAADGYNSVNRSGNKTIINYATSLTEQEWNKKFTITDINNVKHYFDKDLYEVVEFPKNNEIEQYSIITQDGTYYHLKENPYWVGPYGIKVRCTQPLVVDIDNLNCVYKDGRRTNYKFVQSLPNKDSWLLEHTILIDNEYYYKY